MAIKTFCDNPVCNKEFTQNELFGQLMYLSASYDKQMHKMINKNELMFCENCTKDLLKKIQDEIEKYPVDKPKK